MAGLQKYHAHNAIITDPAPNGSAAHYGRTGHGRHLAFVRNCPCDGDLTPRTAYVQGEPDTFYTIPAAVRVKGRNVRGFLTCDTDGWRFTANKF